MIQIGAPATIIFNILLYEINIKKAKLVMPNLEATTPNIHRECKEKNSSLS
jgi:hypothetical protein